MKYRVVFYEFKTEKHQTAINVEADSEDEAQQLATDMMVESDDHDDTFCVNPEEDYRWEFASIEKSDS